jgi:hypothetical protein
VLDQAVALHPDYVLARAGRGVLLARAGSREAAHHDAEAALARDTKPITQYQVAGIYALTSRQEADDRREALRLLASALRQEPRWLKVIPKDPDLDPIRNDPEFERLTQAAAALSRTGAPARENR